uniref:Putative calcium-hydrogen exchanger 2 n=1 Tax=Ganoderma lucidum TaxID=5315 RepID=A0A2R3YAK0_GANLU|nr:putative calcium-hydrogen exchanger 2 [Ganoderma lucidum]
MSTSTPSSSTSDVEKADAGSPNRVMTDQERGPDPSPSPGHNIDAGPHPEPPPVPLPTHGYGEYYEYASSSAQEFWDRLRGKGRRWVGWSESVKNIVLSSWLNVLFIVIPFAWVSFWVKDHKGEHIWGGDITFVLCFLAIIPLEGMFDWGGEQMALYLGKDLGDLVVVTLNNLRLLQATIAGVVILHLLLIPGVAFLVGGTEVRHQELHPHHSELNHSLLMIGVLAMLLPTAFFAALDRGATTAAESGAAVSTELVNDNIRSEILTISRGIAIILLIVYICSRIYMHNPPGDNNALKVPHDAPEELKHEEKHLREEEPLANPWACMILLGITVAIMAITAEMLVESIEFVRESSGIRQEWFGLILLPFVSFSADGAVAVIFFCQAVYDRIANKEVHVPSMLARGRAIDLSIQFTLWWMPFLVLLGWWTGRPMHLLFDYFEVALLLGSCFLVNYVTADSKTNWVEGFIMVAFYVMIALTAWFYPGQPSAELMLACTETVAAAVSSASSEAASELAAEAGQEFVARAWRAVMT